LTCRGGALATFSWKRTTIIAVLDSNTGPVPPPPRQLLRAFSLTQRFLVIGHEEKIGLLTAP
jgi:hypothetical protein